MGSVIGITDEAGNVVGTTKYDAFGQPVDATEDMSLPADTGSDFRFHGRWIEAATGLYDLRAQDYDPVMAASRPLIRPSRICSSPRA